MECCTQCLDKFDLIQATLIYWCIHPRLQLVSETDFRDVNLDNKYYRDVSYYAHFCYFLLNYISPAKVHEDRRVVLARISGSFNFANSSHVREEAERLVAMAEQEAENDKQKVQNMYTYVCTMVI